MGGCSSVASAKRVSKPSTDVLDQTVTERWTGALLVSTSSGANSVVSIADGSSFTAELQQALSLEVIGGGKAMTLASVAEESPITKEKTKGQNKMRVVKSSRILIVGDHRVKVATAKFIKFTEKDVDVVVGVRDPSGSENSSLRAAGLSLIAVNLSETTLYNSIKRLKQIDCAFVVSPATNSKVQETCHAINALKRAGVSHVIVLSNTVVDCERPTFFGDQCRSIEAYIRTTGLSFTIVRVPIYMDNYCSQIDSICNNGVFYRPLDGTLARNIICIADVAEAVGKIALRPIEYADKIISLNGPPTSCEMAARAFSQALNRSVSYERVSRSSYKTMMLNSLIPEWQAEGLLQLFELYPPLIGQSVEQFCVQSTGELEALLGRSAVDINHFARIVVAKMQTSKLLHVSGNSANNLASASADPSQTQQQQQPIGYNLDASIGSSLHSSDFEDPANNSSGSGGVQTSVVDVFHRPPRAIRPSIDVSLHLQPGMGSSAPQGLRGCLNVSIGLKQQSYRMGAGDGGSVGTGGLSRRNSDSFSVSNLGGGGSSSNSNSNNTDLPKVPSKGRLQELREAEGVGLLRTGSSSPSVSSQDSQDLTSLGKEAAQLRNRTKSSSFDSAGGWGVGVNLTTSNSNPPTIPTRTIKINTPAGQMGEIVLPDYQAAAAATAAANAAAAGVFDPADASVHGGSMHGNGNGNWLADGNAPSLRLDNFGRKNVILLDGHLTYVTPDKVSASGTSLTNYLDLGRSNKSFALSGYVVEREDATRLRLVSSKGEDLLYILDAPSADDAALWVERLQGGFFLLFLLLSSDRLPPFPSSCFHITRSFIHSPTHPLIPSPTHTHNFLSHRTCRVL